MENDYHFNEWLREELKKRNITQKDFAEKAGITTATVSTYVNSRKMPTIRTLELILDALDMHMEFIENRRGIYEREGEE